MKLSICIYVLALAPSHIATAFTSPLEDRRRISVASWSQAEEHLEQLSQKWKEFQLKQKELERKNDPDASMDFALEMVETAIEHVHTKEEVEEEHVVSLHKTLKKVLKTEEILQAAAKVAHHNAWDADEVVQAYNRGGFGEDKEKRRELAVADLAHHIEDYAEERLHQAQDQEFHMREEEENAKRDITKLKWNEEVLKYALEGLKALKNEKEEASQ